MAILTGILLCTLAYVATAAHTVNNVRHTFYGCEIQFRIRKIQTFNNEILQTQTTLQPEQPLLTIVVGAM